MFNYIHGILYSINVSRHCHDEIIELRGHEVFISIFLIRRFNVTNSFRCCLWSIMGVWDTYGKLLDIYGSLRYSWELRHLWDVQLLENFKTSWRCDRGDAQGSDLPSIQTKRQRYQFAHTFIIESIWLFSAIFAKYWSSVALLTKRWIYLIVR